MLSPITAIIKSARFFGISVNQMKWQFQNKKREEAGGFASRGAVEKWGHFIMDSSQGGDEKSEGRLCVSRFPLHLLFCF